MSIRIIIKKGNVFKVKLDNGLFRYFQFVGKDISELNGDVIAIFKGHYTNEPVNPATIVNDDIECFLHTSIIAGIELGLWERVYSLPVKIIEKEIIFKASQDVGLYPRQHFVSHRWVIWSMNDERRYVGTLPKEYYNADIGGIYAPKSVISRLETGESPDKFYPDYC